MEFDFEMFVTLKAKKCFPRVKKLDFFQYLACLILDQAKKLNVDQRAWRTLCRHRNGWDRCLRQSEIKCVHHLVASVEGKQRPASTMDDAMTLQRSIMFSGSSHYFDNREGCESNLCGVDSRHV